MNFPEKLPILSQRVEQLHDALAAGDEMAFRRGLAELIAGDHDSGRTELRNVTLKLQQALDDFRSNSRLSILASQEVPDAKVRLEHVLKLTDDAAHRTLDLVEQSVPIADGVSRSAARLAYLPEAELTPTVSREFLGEVRRDMDSLRTHLTEVLLAQGFQDLSGQILRSVMQLVAELEQALGRLLALSGVDTSGANVAAQRNGNDPSVLTGPVVPKLQKTNDVGKQQDVDDLLSGLGL